MFFITINEYMHKIYAATKSDFEITGWKNDKSRKKYRISIL